ncbi:hypothetical protein QPL50_21835, partial [Escherichia coli]|uniref:hypothetical protein n=1 Tax=Escherichia coli TaxID=562 RepID=UPI00287A0D07
DRITFNDDIYRETNFAERFRVVCLLLTTSGEVDLLFPNNKELVNLDIPNNKELVNLDIPNNNKSIECDR